MYDSESQFKIDDSESRVKVDRFDLWTSYNPTFFKGTCENCMVVVSNVGF